VSAADASSQSNLYILPALPRGIGMAKRADHDHGHENCTTHDFINGSLCCRPVLTIDSLEYDPEVNLVKAAGFGTFSKKVAVLRTSASTVPAVYSFCVSTLTLLV
jgi:hypothetical protein